MHAELMDLYELAHTVKRRICRAIVDQRNAPRAEMLLREAFADTQRLLCALDNATMEECPYCEARGEVLNAAGEYTKCPACHEARHVLHTQADAIRAAMRKAQP